MKKLLFIFATMLLFVSCGMSSEKTTETTTDSIEQCMKHDNPYDKPVWPKDTNMGKATTETGVATSKYN